MRKIILLFVLIGLFSSCNNPKLLEKISELEKENAELKFMTDSIQTILNDSLKNYKTELDSLKTFIANKELENISKSKCALANNLNKTLETFEKYYKGIVNPQLTYQVDYPDYNVVSINYNNTIINYEALKQYLTAEQKDNITEILETINKMLPKKYYSGLESRNMQVWLYLAKEQCNRLKKSLCQ